MMKDARYQQIGKEWSVTYLPERPNGFAVFLLSDNGVMTRASDSDWEAHPEKERFVNGLLQRGYTVVVPPLHANHWGSVNDYQMVLHMYHSVLKKEILNKQVHVLAEGTGALLALRWFEKNVEQVRSSYFINPCFNMLAYFRQEQENRWFFKRFVKEIANVYHEDESNVTDNLIRMISPPTTINHVPPLSIHCDINEKRFPLHVHSRPFYKS
ncbi:hypothetical protein [Bacillus sp. JCM 19034]|uniref:hypothetical protein n=1 Tax=Bacillus sp. JCM 19034 TaxID=1481928 RepID=UPI0007806696|nr:hypothetical protein [Bacillus sp. JCM 19034]